MANRKRIAAVCLGLMGLGIVGEGVAFANHGGAHPTPPPRPSPPGSPPARHELPTQAPDRIGRPGD